MTTTGEPHHDPFGRLRRPVPHTLAILGLLTTAVAGGTWAEVHFAGRMHTDRQTSVDGVSQDSTGAKNVVAAPGVGGAGQTSVDDILPLTVTYPSTLTSPDGYNGSRSAVTAGRTDCGAVFSTQAPAAVTSGCSGYLTTDYVRDIDHATYSSVTVLYYRDAATAARVAAALNTPSAASAVDWLQFTQPGGGLPATVSQNVATGTGTMPGINTVLPGGTPGTFADPAIGGLAPASAGAGSSGATPSASSSAGTGAAASGSPGAAPTSTATLAPKATKDPAVGATTARVAAVGRAVTVVQSAFADGRPVSPELDTPTWYLSYTVTSALAWQPDQGPGSAPTANP
jgi:hypothetical protein